MKIKIAEDYSALSKMAADDLLAFTKGKMPALVCTASGDTPAGLYKELVNNKELDTRSWIFLGLDEWVGLNLSLIHI